jgi:hypothetical protein
MNTNDLADRLEQFYTGTHITTAAEVLRKQTEEIAYWKDAFEKAMSLNEQIKHLEAQVYGGTTK